MAQEPTMADISKTSAYQNKLMALLGGRDPVTAMRLTSDSLSELIRPHAASVMRTRPFSYKWTPNEVIGHLIDSEWVYGFRTRLIASECEPTIIGMNMNA